MKKKILSLALAIATTFSLSASAFAANEENMTEESRVSVLAVAETAVEDVTFDEVTASEVSATDTWISKDEAVKLAQIGVDVPDTATVETVISEDDGTYEKIYLNENDFVCVDGNNEIFRISNFGDESEVAAYVATNEDATVDENMVAETIRALLNLSDEYVLIGTEEFDEDYLTVTMSKAYNGIENPYESVNAVIRKTDSNVVYLRVFDTAPETTEATIGENEALSAAADIIAELGTDVTSSKLVFTEPNYYWYNGTDTDYEIADFVRLAYEFVIGDGDWIVDVDAVTGEVIGGDMSMAEKAGCYGQTDTNYYKGATTTKLAVAGYKKLGYTTSSQNSDNGTTLSSTISSFKSGSTAYGLYIRAHGNSAMTRLTVEVDGVFTPILYRTSVSGNWHFVFLDACYTGTDSTWASSFNISSSYASRAYLGWSGTVLTGNSYKFAVQFWPLVGTMSIRNAAVAAAAEVEGSGTTPIRFYGDTSYYGKAWS